MRNTLRNTLASLAVGLVTLAAPLAARADVRIPLPSLHVATPHVAVSVRPASFGWGHRVEGRGFYRSGWVRPAYARPTYVRPTYVRPTYVQPTYVQPAYAQPVYGQ